MACASGWHIGPSCRPSTHVAGAGRHLGCALARGVDDRQDNVSSILTARAPPAPAAGSGQVAAAAGGVVALARAKGCGSSTRTAAKGQLHERRQAARCNACSPEGTTLALCQQAWSAQLPAQAAGDSTRLWCMPTSTNSSIRSTPGAATTSKATAPMERGPTVSLHTCAPN